MECANEECGAPLDDEVTPMIMICWPNEARVAKVVCGPACAIRVLTLERPRWFNGLGESVCPACERK